MGTFTKKSLSPLSRWLTKNNARRVIRHNFYNLL